MAQAAGETGIRLTGQDNFRIFSGANDLHVPGADLESFIWVIHALAGATRRETFQGTVYRVVQAVLVRSQVLHNNLGTVILPASSITDEWANQWNGTPVLVGHHPQLRGEYVSANNPNILNDHGVGFLFNVRAENEDATNGEDGVRRLVGEVWLNESRRAEVEGLDAVLNELDAGRVVELSTGFPTTVVRQPGVYNGEQYEAVLQPAGVDHLVVSTEMTGACSVADGCGLGANKVEDGMNQEEPASTDGTSISTSTSTTPCEKHRETTSLLRRLLDKAGELFAPQVELTDEDYRARLLAREVDTWNQSTPSDDERAMLLRDALQAQFGSTDRHVMLNAVFSEEQLVVYWLETPMGSKPAGAEFYQSSFEEADGQVTFSEPIRVRRMTMYEPVAGNATVDPAEGAADNATADAAANVTTEEEESAMAENKELAVLAEAVAKLTEEVSTIREQLAGDPHPAIAGLKQEVGKLAAEVEKGRGVTSLAVEERERERKALVKELVGNFRVTYTEEELNAKPLEELRKLRRMASGEDYSMQGGGPRDPDKETKYMTPVPYFEKDKSKADAGN